MNRYKCGLWGFVTVFLVSVSSGARVAAAQQQQLQRSSIAKPIPALAPGQKPNFIMILTDDVGYDDVGFHNPRVKTPNIDRFRERSTVFENFYTTPQCAQSRAQFLTGRSFARTGTMAVNAGWDFMSRDEVTLGEAMAAGGYRTAHFGKWHNAQVLGYEPWHNGFENSYVAPPPGSGGQGLARVNGRYVPAQEQGNVYDKDLRNRTIDYLQERVKDGQPFFVFLATQSIHTNYVLPDLVTGLPMERRIVPAEYRDKFSSPEYNGVAESTKDAWAFMEYLDDALGPLFDFLASSGLDQSTYLMFTGDNGPAVLPDEVPPQGKRIRMPSGMARGKHTVFEGGIRNFLAVQGPGVKPGEIDNTMIVISDIFPTMVDIAGVNGTVPQGRPLDGISFKNVLLPNSSNNKTDMNSGSRGSRTAGAADVGAAGAIEAQQQSSLTSRYFFMLAPQCWGANAVPELGPDRTVLKPQKLLDYRVGGVSRQWTGTEVLQRGPGFKSCIVVRFGDYKWHGKSGKVYQFGDENQHLENAKTEVTGETGAILARKMERAAKEWWRSIINEPASFQKPTFYLGLGNWTVTNMLAAGAHERTPVNVQLLADGATGFYSAGDSMCFKLKVLAAGRYTATAIYTSNLQATFRLFVGSYASIKDGAARHLTVQWPAQDTMRGMLLGNLTLPASKGEKTEACLQLLDSPALDGKTAHFINFANIQWTRINRRLRASEVPQGVNTNINENSNKMNRADLHTKDIGADSNDDGRSRSVPSAPTAPARAIPVAVSAPGLDLSGRHSWVRSVALNTDGLNTNPDAWTALRLKNGWTEGQSVLESMFSPYDAEGIEECPAELHAACRPPV